MATDTQATTELSLLLDFHNGGAAGFLRATRLREAARLTAATKAYR